MEQLQRERTKTAQLEGALASLRGDRPDGGGTQGLFQPSAAVLESALFEPPLPPTEAEYPINSPHLQLQRQEQQRLHKPSEPEGDGADSTHSVNSQDSLDSANSANMRELARLREEVRLMEAHQP